MSRRTAPSHAKRPICRVGSAFGPDRVRPSSLAACILCKSGCGRCRIAVVALAVRIWEGFRVNMPPHEQQFEALPGLPTYGPVAESFSATGQGTHREGYVVRFFPRNCEPWVGNFQPGLTSFCCVLPHPDGARMIVVSSGQGYVINPEDRESVEFIGAWYQTAHWRTDRSALLLGTPIDFEAIGRNGRLWRTRRVSFDGMRDIAVTESDLRGEAWSPLDDRWYPFRVDLSTGSVEGGSYIGPE